MKATISEDGLKRATVQVSFRIDIDELAIVAAYLMHINTKGKLSKRKIEDQLRFELESEGHNGLFRKDEDHHAWFGDTWAELKSRARDLVLELYPEFQDVAQRRRAI